VVEEKSDPLKEELKEELKRNNFAKIIISY